MSSRLTVQRRGTAPVEMGSSFIPPGQCISLTSISLPLSYMLKPKPVSPFGPYAQTLQSFTPQTLKPSHAAQDGLSSVKREGTWFTMLSSETTRVLDYG